MNRRTVRRQRVGRLPLRTRVMAWFSLVSLVIAGALALATWHLSTGYMIDQRERSAVRQTTSNARLIEAALRRDSAGLPELITGLGSEAESAVLIVDNGETISSGNLVDPTRLPPQFLRLVSSGTPARQRTRLDDIPVLAVGLPLRDQAATYVEVSPLRELDRTFQFLSWILLAGTAASGVAGALVGRWAANHALRPLRQVTGAAAKAVRGDLEVRLPVTGDPDLVPLAEAFNDTASRLQQRIARDTRFAGDVSHELRSPLTTMLNAMAVLQRRSAELPPSTRAAVALLDTDLRRFRRMVDDLLEISRGEDTDRSTFEQLDIAELVRATARHGNRLDADLLDIDAHPRVLADRRRLPSTPPPASTIRPPTVTSQAPRTPRRADRLPRYGPPRPIQSHTVTSNGERWTRTPPGTTRLAETAQRRAQRTLPSLLLQGSMRTVSPPVLARHSEGLA
ncbi:MAG: histidine kinase dimerization/phospho-acceptor domain-containing protein [Actinophytocola sp.]|uniref:histidine kinase dimerization/phospho-acceptor domain-containing protein n=1 Tax=Actinophytocola sp. TaxID=1872138 RepID=UPI003D6A4925